MALNAIEGNRRFLALTLNLPRPGSTTCFRTPSRQSDHEGTDNISSIMLRDNSRSILAKDIGELFSACNEGSLDALAQLTCASKHITASVLSVIFYPSLVPYLFCSAQTLHYKSWNSLMPYNV